MKANICSYVFCVWKKGTYHIMSCRVKNMSSKRGKKEMFTQKNKAAVWV